MNFKSFIKNFINNFFTIENEDTTYHFSLSNDYNHNENTYLEKQEDKNIFQSLDINLDYMKAKYNSDISSDIIIREFNLLAKNRQYKSFLVFIDGMVDTDLINNYVLKPLMPTNQSNFSNQDNNIYSEVKTNNIIVRKIKKFNLKDYISSCLLPQNSIQEVSKFSKIINGINSGNCALFIDTLNIAYDIDVKGFKQRDIDTPQNEVVINGPHECLVENIRTNTSQIRRIINNENLIIQNTEIGKLTKTKCAICYIKNITNSELVNETKFRLNNLDIDSVLSSGELEQLISDSSYLGIPSTFSTERPDTVSRNLLQGKIVILINGSPNAIIVPTTISDFLSSPEDINLKPYLANFLKGIRLLGALITLLLPSIYVAITSFHQEIFPTELLFAILSARENVPFPLIIEILLMEIAIELIREAGIRVPSQISFTISIVRCLSHW